MIAALDTSSFLKRYLPESGAEQLNEALRVATEVHLSRLVIVESVSAIRRAGQRGAILAEDVSRILNAIRDDSLDVFHVDPLTDRICLDTIEMLQSLGSLPLRAADALQIQSARAVRADLFVTADKQQASAARDLGLGVELLTPA